MNWQKVSGYNDRALVEADIGLYQRVIGDALRSQTDARQTPKSPLLSELSTGCWSSDAPNMCALYNPRSCHQLGEKAERRMECEAELASEGGGLSTGSRRVGGGRPLGGCEAGLCDDLFDRIDDLLGRDMVDHVPGPLDDPQPAVRDRALQPPSVLGPDHLVAVPRNDDDRRDHHIRPDRGLGGGRRRPPA